MPVDPTITRRSMFAAAALPAVSLPAFALTGLTACNPPASAAGHTTIMALFAEWQAAIAYANDGAKKSDEELDARIDAVAAIEERISHAPCQTVKDLAAKVYALTSGGDFPLDNAVLWNEIEGILA